MTVPEWLEGADRGYQDGWRAGASHGYEQAVDDAQERLRRLLTHSSLSFGDLQGVRLALIVIGQISPDTNEIAHDTGDAETV